MNDNSNKPDLIGYSADFEYVIAVYRSKERNDADIVFDDPVALLPKPCEKEEILKLPDIERVKLFKALISTAKTISDLNFKPPQQNQDL